MPQIAIRNMYFTYEGSHDAIFENVSLTLDTDWKLGLVGRNGRGKTTLLRLLLQELVCDAGSISSPAGFAYFPFPQIQEDWLTVDVLEQLCPTAQPWQWSRECNLLELDQDIWYRPFDTLSQGERAKAQLAALFLQEERFLLIDEPTNHLDLHGRKTVAAYLNQKKGFMLVSHDRNFLDGCIDHVLAINKTGFELARCDFSTWQHNKDLRDAFEQRQNEKLQSEIYHLSEAARKTAGWSDAVERTKIGTGVYDRGAVGHKAAKMMKRSKAIEQRRQSAVAEKEQLLKDIEYDSPLILRKKEHYAQVLVSVKDIAIQYADTPVCAQVSFAVQQGECVALTGKNGCGKSSLLRLIAGETIPHTGTVQLASGLIVSYVPQDTSFLQGNLSDYARAEQIDETLFKTILRKLDFLRVQFEKDMRDFSAGQQKKVLLARSLCQQAHLYIWDEPLNYVDIYSRQQIVRVIKNFGPSILLVEHDQAFLEDVGAKMVRLL